MITQGETTEREQAANERCESFDLLERYRLTVYDSARNDFSTVECALWCIKDKLAVAHRAICDVEAKTESDTTLIIGTRIILDEAIQTMSQALTMLDICELERG